MGGKKKRRTRSKPEKSGADVSAGPADDGEYDSGDDAFVDGRGGADRDGSYAEMHDPTELLDGSGAENINKQWSGRWHGGVEVEDVSDNEEVEGDL